jgi:hypothetical protein
LRAQTFYFEVCKEGIGKVSLFERLCGYKKMISAVIDWLDSSPHKKAEEIIFVEKLHDFAERLQVFVEEMA